MAENRDIVAYRQYEFQFRVGLAQESEQLSCNRKVASSTERLLAPPSWVLMCPWARHLTLTAPDELGVALHAWLNRRCAMCVLTDVSRFG
jgi:hypothetical protein